MDWTDQGIIVGIRPHGEASYILSVLTQNHGKHCGYVRGGRSKKTSILYQEGNLIQVSWQSRIEENLGSFRCELMSSVFGDIFKDRVKIAALRSATSLIDTLLSERTTYPAAFEELLQLLKALKGDNWHFQYLYWEMHLLSILGFGVDLSECGATGSREDLIYVSPKTARAISKTSGAPYHDRMLSLPRCLLEPISAPLSPDNQEQLIELKQGLTLTGYFLKKHLFSQFRSRAEMVREDFLGQVLV